MPWDYQVPTPRYEWPFTPVDFAGEWRPDDAPPARLDQQAIVPGAILPVLREFFTGDTKGPREVFMTRADLARLSEAGQA